ncbi:leucine-rich repeat neuronal protein 1 [Plutella xylostella]|uniref:leucine-rich repeat neuronal protein 1 n=1 Tax=Plutella xylostella TaxID=51655 RepID=UPI0020323F57|nr:leucine-rich repeat neuronal protein 1 [Plutella xylostella]
MILLCLFIVLISHICVSESGFCGDDLRTCVCRYNNKENEDFLALDIDCSYSEISLNASHELPKAVRTLDLSSSKLTHITESNLFKSTSLQVLYLDKNDIISIDIHALQLPALKILDLSNNKLEFLDPEVFQRTKQLDYLNLASNAFKTFSLMNFHHLSALKEIVLDDNSIGTHLQQVNLFQHDGLALTTKIKNISIKGISMDYFPENFLLDAYDLRRLSVANNNISVIPELPFTLEYLDLSDNPITDIDAEDFSELPALKELRLNNLLIKEVKEYVFASMKNLVKLELQNNRMLSNFSSLAFGNEVLDDPTYLTLESLSLRSCRLWTLSKELEVPFGQLTKLDLQGNPWKCDCNLLWMKELQLPEDDIEHFRCNTPRAFYNAKISELNAKYFVCRRLKSQDAGIIAAIAFITILTSIALWLFFCLPRYQKRSDYLMKNINYPSTVYSILPLTQEITQDR